mgnify:CR=1 FL=1
MRFMVRQRHPWHELELPEGLLAVGRAGAGVNNIPLDECAKKGIVYLILREPMQTA